MADNLKEILTFTVDDQRFAIRLQAVERVIRAVAVTRLSNSPDFIEGVIDYYGAVIAVINLRKRFGFPMRKLSINDRFIIATTTKRKLALIVDQVETVMLPNPKDLFETTDFNEGSELITILRDDNGIIILNDLEHLLIQSEEIILDHFFESKSSTKSL
jgi:purine-binding chemotaxis protein CheW